MTKQGHIITQEARFRGALPSTFQYGCASASYQIEGGFDEDGKGPNVWDVAMKDMAENGNKACDSYHLWRDDIELLKKYGCNTYRFSISWARVRPLGGKDDPVNEAGIKYYSDLIDALLAAGIKPFVTIFHWDHPQALEDRYGGFTDDRIIEDFEAYADLLFERFGDRVTDWITINEPQIVTLLNASVIKKDTWKTPEDLSKAVRTLILSHARSVDLYRRKYQPKQKGQIGITLNCEWAEPIDDSPEAAHAAKAVIDWMMSLYAEPIYLGKLPELVQEELGDYPVKFSDEEWKIIKGSSDFFGQNHYGTMWTTGKRAAVATASHFGVVFGLSERVPEKDGKIIGNKGHNGHPYDTPWGFRKLLRHVYEKYTKDLGIDIIITENGFAVENEGKKPFEERINDTERQHYYAGYLKELIEAVVDDGIPIGGYMSWSLLDNLEWTQGYEPKFGITICDLETGKRTPKDSAYMLKDIFSHSIAK